VFENRLLKRLYGQEGDKLLGGRKKLHNKELHYFCSLPNKIRSTKSRRMRWAGHVARMVREAMYTGILWGT
jgi:hypothetical protein